MISTGSVPFLGSGDTLSKRIVGWGLLGTPRALGEFNDSQFGLERPVTQLAYLNLSESRAEVARLQEELQMRDQLVQQLSQELFRMVKGNTSFMPSSELSGSHQAEVRALREQLQGVEQQVSFYQEQLEERDAEIYQLRQTVQELSDRSRMLEQVVQELPKVYRQKFKERMAVVKDKVSQIQRENRQLQAELQSVSYRLAVRTRRVQELDLPSFAQPMAGSMNIPGFGNA